MSYQLYALTVFHFRCGDFVFRAAVPDDKEMILNIRKNLYDGLDFMPEFFHQLVTPVNGSSLLVLHEDKVVNWNWLANYIDSLAIIISQLGIAMRLSASIMSVRVR